MLGIRRRCEKDKGGILRWSLVGRKKRAKELFLWVMLAVYLFERVIKSLVFNLTMNRGRRVVYTLYVSIALPGGAPILVAMMGFPPAPRMCFAAFFVDIYTASFFTFSFPSLYH